MNLNRLGPVLVAMILATTVAHAQPEKKKLYRYVDKDGKVTYVDALPADAADAARKEISVTSGQTTGTVDRALTAEERAVAQVKAESDAKAAVAAAQEKLLEESMLVNYQTEADLRHAYDERITLLQQTIESTDISLKNVRAGLASLLGEASEAELNGRPVPPKRVELIRELRGEMVKQQSFQVNRMNELATLNGEFDRMLKRYREVRGEATPATPAPATSPPAPATPAGSR